MSTRRLSLKVVLWIFISILSSLLVGGLVIFLLAKQAMNADNGKPIVAKISLQEEKLSKNEGGLILKDLKHATYQIYIVVFPKHKEFKYPLNVEEYHVRDSLTFFLDMLFKNASLKTYYSLTNPVHPEYTDSANVCCCINLNGFLGGN
jgi:hypothetical protein